MFVWGGLASGVDGDEGNGVDKERPIEDDANTNEEG